MSNVLKTAMTLFIYSKGNKRCVGLQRVLYSPDIMTNTFGKVETWTFAPRKLHTITKYALCMYPTFVMTPDKYNPAEAEKVKCNIIPEMDGLGRLFNVGRDEIICTVCSALKLGSTKKLSASNLSTSTTILDESKIDDTRNNSIAFRGKISKVFGLNLGTFRDRLIAKLFRTEFEIELDHNEGIQLSGPTDLSDTCAPKQIKRHIRNLVGTKVIKFDDIDGITLLETDYVKSLRQRFGNGK